MMALPLQASNEKLVTSRCKRGLGASKKIVALISLSALFVTALGAADQEEPYGNPEHEREELGINRYTAPSIAQIFEQLDKLKPLPYEDAKRPLPTAVTVSREQKGLIFGGLIADGFLIVAAERKNLVEEFGRVLLREARSLGVGEQVTRHSASLTQMGKSGNWAAVRKELIGTQEDVEQAMINLRDEKMAHLISLGGWLRGLEISATAVVKKFSPERARILSQPELTNYFAQELNTLPPELAHTPLMDKIRDALRAVASVLRKSASASPKISDVRAIQAEARAVNDTIRNSN